jgi:3D (Asp-Asp-Asp) domain-containing protein
MLLPDGSTHDGMWYASDTGGAIKGKTVDLFTGSNRKSLIQFGRLNIANLNAAVVGTFQGCPK